MPFRDINNLTTEQRARLTEIEDAIVGQDMHLEVFGLHSTRDEIVCEVQCPYEGWRSEEAFVINAFVFNRSPRLKLTAEGIAADYALRRDSAYGL